VRSAAQRRHIRRPACLPVCTYLVPQRRRQSGVAPAAPTAAAAAARANRRGPRRRGPRRVVRITRRGAGVGIGRR
jgi:hypothetical protein